MPFTVHVTLSTCCRETPRVYPSRDVAIQFAIFESGGLQHLWYPSRESLPFADSWCEGVERTSAEWRLLNHTVIATFIVAVIASGVVVWMHVFTWMVEILNINFEPLTFCCVLFVSLILVCVNVIDINMCKVLILCEMCYFCVWDFHTVWWQHNECVARNSYANDFGILLWSCARNIMKICQYL